MLLTVVLEKTLESPLDSKEIQPVHPKGDRPECSLEGLMLKLKCQYIGHLMRRTDSFENTLILVKIEGRRRKRYQRMRYQITDIRGLSDCTEVNTLAINTFSLACACAGCT